MRPASGGRCRHRVWSGFCRFRMAKRGAAQPGSISRQPCSPSPGACNELPRSAMPRPCPCSRRPDAVVSNFCIRRPGHRWCWSEVHRVLQRSSHSAFGPARTKTSPGSCCSTRSTGLAIRRRPKRRILAVDSIPRRSARTHCARSALSNARRNWCARPGIIQVRGTLWPPCDREPRAWRR